MEITSREVEDKTVASVNGRLDAVSAPEFQNQLLALVDQGAKELLLDFAGVDYISSAGLRSILVVAKKLRTGQGMLSVAMLQDTVKEVFEISGFNSILPVFDTVEAALSH